MDLSFSKKLILTVIFLWLPVNAQNILSPEKDSVYQLSEVVISANRYETSLLKTPSSVTIIDSFDIISSRKTSLFDLINNQYGLSLIQSGGPGKLSVVSMRGGNASHTLVLLDGVEMNMPNDPTSTYDFANLPLNNIKRIEILRGPQSTLYGSDAMAGVLNIMTYEGASEPVYFINAEAGNYDTYSGSAGMSGRFNFLNYNLNVSTMNTGGFSSASEKYGNYERDGAENKTASSSLGFHLNENIKLNLITRFTKGTADYDQFGGENGDDPTYIFKLEETIIHPEIRADYGNWNQKLGFSFYRNLRKYSFDSTAAYYAFSNSFYDGKKYKLDWLHSIKLSDKVHYSLGIDVENESAFSEYKEFNSAGSYETSFPENKMNTTGIFAQNSLEPLKNTFFSWGIRYDMHNRFGTIVTYRLASSYFIESTATKFKSTYGTGFKTPSLFNLYDPTFGNENLKPEKSTGWDIGFEQFFLNNSISIGANYFSTDYEQLFGYDESFRTININAAKANGIETFSAFFPWERLNLRFNYTYTKSRDKNPLLTEREQILIRRPEHKAGINLNIIPTDAAVISLDIIYYGTRADKNFSSFPAEIIDLDPYTLINAAVSYKLFRFLEIYSRFENILDQDYEQIYGYATPGFGMYGGFRLNF